MKALTLWRPWSDAIVHGPKRIENRTWVPPARVVGEVIAIHAGKRYDTAADRYCEARGFAALNRHGCPGGIVGVARIVGASDPYGFVWAEDPYDERLVGRLSGLRTDPWWIGPVGWLLDDVIAIEPIPCRGAQGLWTVPADLDALVLDRVAAAERDRLRAPADWRVV